MPPKALSATPTLDATATQCDAEYQRQYGAAPSPIPWMQIIQMLLSLLAGCGIAANRAARIMQRPGFFHNQMLIQAISATPGTAGIEEECFVVLRSVGGTVDEVKAGALLSEAQ